MVIYHWSCCFFRTDLGNGFSKPEERASNYISKSKHITSVLACLTKHREYMSLAKSKLGPSSHFPHPENHLYHYNYSLIIQACIFAENVSWRTPTMLEILHPHPKHTTDLCNTLTPPSTQFLPTPASS